MSCLAAAGIHWVAVYKCPCPLMMGPSPPHSIFEYTPQHVMEHWQLSLNLVYTNCIGFSGSGLKLLGLRVLGFRVLGF